MPFKATNERQERKNGGKQDERKDVTLLIN